MTAAEAERALIDAINACKRAEERKHDAERDLCRVYEGDDAALGRA